MLLGAASGIGYEAVREIRTPHEWPAGWTLVVLVVVMATKWVLSRRVASVGAQLNSTAVAADAAHHMSDAITSAAAFVGISVAVTARSAGAGQGWAAADDWAALLAAGVVARVILHVQANPRMSLAGTVARAWRSGEARVAAQQSARDVRARPHGAVPGTHGNTRNMTPPHSSIPR
jgi:hypothetical protein